jgi:MFS transporter, putative metabolite:H+ symporter
MLDLLEQQKSLTLNQWKIFTACLFSIVIDFFDFALIGFVLTFFVKDWRLTFGQSGAILFASGVGAIPGGIFFGWLGDKIGRRKVFMMMILTLSFATGVTALAPENGWIFIATMRFIVGLGVGGLAAVDLPLLQEFVPASKRGWVSGLSIGLLPLGPLLAALLSASVGAAIGWRGLFAIGLVPAAFAFVIRLWVPESPRWLIGRGRFEEARCSLAWALKVDLGDIQLPTALPEQPRVSWLELFKYPRSIAVGILTGLSSTGAVGVALWGATLLVLVLKVTPAQAAYLSIWIALVGIPGRAVGSWMSDALGRRWAGVLLAVGASCVTAFAGYLHDVYIGTVSVFLIMLLLASFFSNASFSVVFPYMAELWPAKLRASGFGLVYGCSNCAKFIGPAGLAVIAGATNYVAPKATLDALVPAFIYFAAWYLLAVGAFLFVGI